MEVYKPVIKKFLGKDVRIITIGYDEYVVAKDIFNCLGRLDSRNDVTTRDNIKLDRLLSRIRCDRTFCTVTSKTSKSKSRETQTVSCIPVEKVPLVTIQFEPKSTDIELNKIYDEFLIWVENLLEEAQAHKVILKDKEVQKEESSIIVTVTGKKMVVVNSDICRLMAELVGVYPEVRKLTKDDLKIYQPQLTIDLIEVRQEALNIYRQQLVITESHKQAYDGTLKYLKKMYKL